MFFPGDRMLALEVVVEGNVCLCENSSISDPRVWATKEFFPIFFSYFLELLSIQHLNA